MHTGPECRRQLQEVFSWCRKQWRVREREERSRSMQEDSRKEHKIKQNREVNTRAA